MAKTNTSPRYVIDIAGMDLLSLGEFGERLIRAKIKKMRYFLTYERVIRS